MSRRSVVASSACVPLAAALASAVLAPVGRAEVRHVPWRPGSYLVDGAAPVRVATISAAPGVPAYVAWIDHARTRLALYPGLGEPPGAVPRGTGAIPSGERWRLLATFNGGFKSNAGAGGFLVNGHAASVLRRGLGTVVEYRSGRVDIVDWQRGPAPPGLVLARQNLPLLVDAARPSPNLSYGPSWGATLHGALEVWRSAIGINRKGNLLYAAADRQTAPSLARLMIQIGAIRAIELDINPEWPSFNGYARRGGRDPIKLVPNGQQSAYRWLTPDYRDFFAVYTRSGGGPFVPFR